MNYNDLVVFRIGICRKSGGSNKSGFERINNGWSSVNGIFNIKVNPISYIVNKWSFRDLKQGKTKGINFFDDYLIDSLDSLSISFAVRMHNETIKKYYY